MSNPTIIDNHHGALTDIHALDGSVLMTREQYNRSELIRCRWDELEYAHRIYRAILGNRLYQLASTFLVSTQMAFKFLSIDTKAVWVVPALIEEALAAYRGSNTHYPTFDDHGIPTSDLKRVDGRVVLPQKYFVDWVDGGLYADLASEMIQEYVSQDVLECAETYNCVLDVVLYVLGHPVSSDVDEDVLFRASICAGHDARPYQTELAI